MKKIYLVLSFLVLITVSAKAELPVPSNWIGKHPTDLIEYYNLYDLPWVKQALEQALGQGGAQGLQENSPVSQQVQSLDGLIIVMAKNSEAGVFSEHAIFIENEKVIGLCVAESRLYRDPGSMLPQRHIGLERHVVYYVSNDARGIKRNHVVNIQAFDQQASCGNQQVEEAAKRWQAVIQLLLPE